MLLKVVLHCSFLKLKKSFQINNLKNLNLIVKTYYKKPSDGAQDFIGRYVTLWVSKFVSNLGLVMVLMWYIHSMGLVVGGGILPTHDTGNPKGSAVGPWWDYVIWLLGAATILIITNAPVKELVYLLELD